MELLGFGLAGIGVTIDSASAYLGVRNVFVKTPSGIPVIGWCLFALGCWCLAKGDVLSNELSFEYMRLYALVHMLLNFGVPLLVLGLRKIMRK